jgi:hypothetical protein
MAIRNRRGDYNDYRPSKMLSGELAVTLQNDPKAIDGKALHASFGNGVDKTLMTFEDAEAMIEDASEQAATEAVEAATHQAEIYAENSSTSATQSQSYAVGGTGSRAGENTDNSKYYKEEAASSASNAASSASNASSSASAAASSASQAGSSADRASSSASEAALSASQAASSASQAGSSADRADSEAEKSEAWAVGTKDGVPVGSSEDQYNNNSKHWAEQARSTAQTVQADKIFTNFAHYEATTTASQSYKIGDYLTHNGYLYRVTSPIASGGVITIGTNVIQTSVGYELNNLLDTITIDGVRYAATHYVQNGIPYTRLVEVS